MEIRVEGRIGKDGASFREFGEKTERECVANFSLAEKKYKRQKDGSNLELPPVWHDVAVWGKYARSIYKYLVQGRKVEIDGTLDEPDVRTVRDEETGKQYTIVRQHIRANRVKWMDNKGAANPDAATESAEETISEPLPFDPDNP